MRGCKQSYRSSIGKQCLSNYACSRNFVLSQSQLHETCRCIIFLFFEIRSFLCSKSAKSRVLGAEVKNIFISCSYIVGLQHQTAGTVQNHKADHENLFITIIENGHDWGSETVCSVRGYLALSRDIILIFS